MKLDKRLPKQSIGDVIDRVTILTRKIQFGEHDAYKEFVYLTESLDALGVKLSGALLACIIRLAQMNFEVWNRENWFRRSDGIENTPEMDKKVRLMMEEVRDFNKKRVEYKNEINRLLGMGFREFKIKHRSQ